MDKNNKNKETLQAITTSKKIFENIFGVELLPVVDKYTQNFYPDIDKSNCLTDFKISNDVYVCFYPVWGVKNGFCLVDVSNMSQPKIVLTLQRELDQPDWVDLIKDKYTQDTIKKILAI